ncbi:MAG: hypothetical protein H0X13_17885 [Ramlibacter sp.]|nr:hypothetical protein [Ramlibacter sp.]
MKALIRKGRSGAAPPIEVPEVADRLPVAKSFGRPKRGARASSAYRRSLVCAAVLRAQAQVPLGSAAAAAVLVLREAMQALDGEMRASRLLKDLCSQLESVGTTRDIAVEEFSEAVLNLLQFVRQRIRAVEHSSGTGDLRGPVGLHWDPHPAIRAERVSQLNCDIGLLQTLWNIVEAYSGDALTSRTKSVSEVLSSQIQLIKPGNNYIRLMPKG